MPTRTLPGSLPDYPVFDFSGGVRRDKSPYQLADNELESGRNFEIDQKGRLKKRRGSVQLGQTVSGNVIAFHHDANGFFCANDASTAVIYKLASAIHLGALTTASTSILVSAGIFAASGNVEIEGDLIAYTGGTTTLTGVTGITSPHAANNGIHQWTAIDLGGSTDNTNGCWFTFLNSLTVILTGNGQLFTYNGTSVSAVSGEPTGCRLLETFRDRIFMTNGSLVYFSNLGDATSWPTTVADNSFTLEDQTGESITAIKQYGANLTIWKPSSFYSYSGSLPVRQISSSYGVHNDNCIQEINGLIYGAGPNGIFVTNGESVVPIDQPVKEYYKDFTFGRISSTSTVQTLFTGQWENKFLVYIGDVSTVESMSDVVLAYDTIAKTWEVWSGWSDITAMKYLKRFTDANRNQQRSVLLIGTSTKAYRAFENRFTEVSTGGGTGAARGGDLYADFFSDTGNDIPFSAATKPYDLKSPHIRKQFRYIKLFSETIGMNVSYRIDGGNVQPLGRIAKKVQRFEFKSDARGYRCQLIFDESSQSQPVILDGFIFEETVALDKNG